MTRREFIARLGAAGAYAAVPRVARAQQDTRVRRLAMLLIASENQAQTEANNVTFWNELAKLGIIRGGCCRPTTRRAEVPGVGTGCAN
jgi:hypothetical protein